MSMSVHKDGHIKDTGGVQRHKFSEAVASDKRWLALLPAQFIHNQAFNDEECWLGVAGVVEISGIGLRIGLPLADRQ